VAIDREAGDAERMPSTTFAVFRPTPGSVVSLSMSAGTSPSNSAMIFCAAPTIALPFWLKNPVDLMSGSSCAGVARASAVASGNFLKSAGVTMFTRTSVDCAERIVATSSSNALR
jgi:hypothetical protein